jgi:hypothetical protein
VERSGAGMDSLSRVGQQRYATRWAGDGHGRQANGLRWAARKRKQGESWGRSAGPFEEKRRGRNNGPIPVRRIKMAQGWFWV